ncbi:MAG TPA: peptidyl-alpha-hydroxyglycine alpha-amidating lyase family protein [Vicinamibacterales bacterium]
MKRFIAMLFVLFGATSFAQQPPPEIPFDSVPNFFKLPPDLNFGEGAGVALNSKGHIFVYTRSNSAMGPAYAATASQLLEFGPDGKFIREIGKGLYAWSFAHAVRVDKDDNIWCIDKGSDMIVKFNPEGHVMMVFGRKKEASDEAAAWTRVNPPRPPVDGQFRQPTDVAWNPQGDLFISDGYVNARVAKYDKNGDWVKSFGEPGSGPGQLNTPHSIAADAKGNIYVADRGNSRIQVFDSDGKLEREIKINLPVPEGARTAIGPTPANPEGVRGTMGPGAPWAICITPGPNQVLYASDAFPGRIYKMDLQGKILGTLGKSGKQLKQFGWIHEIACPSENELYVAEVLNWRVQKLLLHPDKTMSTK